VKYLGNEGAVGNAMQCNLRQYVKKSIREIENIRLMRRGG